MTGRCVYCSRKTSGIACFAHSDLPAIDPVYSPDMPQKQKPAEDFPQEALLNRLQRERR